MHNWVGACLELVRKTIDQVRQANVQGKHVSCKLARQHQTSAKGASIQCCYFTTLAPLKLSISIS